MKGRVLINLLNYNSEDFLKNCIESIENQTYRNIKLIITDNRSTDKSITYIKYNYAHIYTYFNSENLGFAKAHNMIIEVETFDYYMPLNPDMILEANFVEELVNGIEKYENIGGVNGKIYFLNQRGEKTSYIYSAGHEFNRARRPSNRGYKLIDNEKYCNEYFIFGVNGAAPLYKKEFLEDVKINGYYFDKDFFMYGDDFDIGWRGILMGYRFLYVPRAEAYHRGFGSEGLKNKFIQYQYERNRFISIYKNDFLSFFIIDLPVFIFHEIFNLVFYLWKAPGRVKEYFSAIFGFIHMISKKKGERNEIMSKRKIDKKSIRKFYYDPWFFNLLKRYIGFKNS